MAAADAIEFLKKSTKSLIEFEPTLITLTHPPVMVANDRGGVVSSGSPTVESAAKQRFFSQTTPTEVVVIKSEGKEIVVNWVLIGTFDDDIREGDVFTVNSVPYKVWTVHDDRRWQTKGLVSRA